MERPLYHYGYVTRRYDDLVAAIGDDPVRLLHTATATARDEARRLVATLHVDVGGFEVGRRVTVAVGDGQLSGAHTTVYPIGWNAEKSAHLFPAMGGQLELTGLSNHPPLTQLTFVGHYQPPGGAAGGLLDRAIGHRVAEAAIHGLLRDVADQLCELVPAFGAIEEVLS